MVVVVGTTGARVLVVDVAGVATVADVAVVCVVCVVDAVVLVTGARVVVEVVVVVVVDDANVLIGAFGCFGCGGKFIVGNVISLAVVAGVFGAGSVGIGNVMVLAVVDGVAGAGAGAGFIPGNGGNTIFNGGDFVVVAGGVNVPGSAPIGNSTTGDTLPGAAVFCDGSHGSPASANVFLIRHPAQALNEHLTVATFTFVPVTNVIPSHAVCPLHSIMSILTTIASPFASIP